MLNTFYRFVFFLCLISGIAIYALNFNDISESSMVSLAYFWVPGVAFGGIGYMSRKKGNAKSLVNAFMGAGLTLGALFLFIEGIFPSL